MNLHSIWTFCSDSIRFYTRFLSIQFEVSADIFSCTDPLRFENVVVFSCFFTSTIANAIGEGTRRSECSGNVVRSSEQTILREQIGSSLGSEKPWWQPNLHHSCPSAGHRNLSWFVFFLSITISCVDLITLHVTFSYTGLGTVPINQIDDKNLIESHRVNERERLLIKLDKHLQFCSEYGVCVKRKTLVLTIIVDQAALLL